MRNFTNGAGTRVLAIALLAGIGLAGCKQKPDQELGDSLPRNLGPEPVPVEPVTPPVTTEPSPPPSIAPETPSQPLSRGESRSPLQST